MYTNKNRKFLPRIRSAMCQKRVKNKTTLKYNLQTDSKHSETALKSKITNIFKSLVLLYMQIPLVV